MEKELTNQDANRLIMERIQRILDFNGELSFGKVLQLLSINQTWNDGESVKIIDNTQESSQRILTRIINNEI